MPRGLIKRFPVGPCGVLIASLLFLLLPYLSHAQQVTGNLQGRLADSLGQAISNANIVVSGPNVQGVRGGVSDGDGYFTLQALPTGIVSVSVTHVQYQRVIFENVSVVLGRTTSLGEVRLRSRSHDLPQVVVSGKRPLLDPSTTSSGVNLRSSDIENLPVERNYRSIATLLPQANTSYYGDEVNIGGATGSENKYFVDGVDVTDPNFGMTGTNLPYNFVKEIQVITGGYEAEYRSALGGLINVITPSGGNETHGSVFGFYTSNRLTAPRRVGLLDPTQGGFSNYDVGFGIGGPIVLDELWFYAAYNPTFSRRDVDMPGFGVSVDKTVTHAFAGKLTWRVSDRLNLVLTSTGDPNDREAIGDAPPLTPNPARLDNPDPYLTDQRGGGINVALNGSYVLGDGILVDATLSRNTRDQTWEPSTERGKNKIVLINTETGTWGGGSFGRYSISRSGTTARIAGTVLTGPHILKGGIEYRDNEVEADLDFPNSLSRHSDTLYVLVLNGTHGTVHNRIPSLFLQETWQVARNLQVHAGLRWDGQFIIGGDGKLAQRITGPFQPRVGFVFLPDNDGTQKVFGSFGRFTQEWHTAVMTGAYTGTGYFYEIHYDHDPRLEGSAGDTVVNTPARILPEERGLKAQYYDEFSLGYERMISTNVKIRLQGIHRTLQQAITAGLVQGGFRLGNPGRGELSDFPRAQRDYTALVITVEQRGGDHFNFLASYVLSRNYGNYEGLYDSYTRNIVPNVNFTFADVNSLREATGLLPNDRTHVLKFSGSYRFDSGLIVGTSFLWQTGTPLSDIASFGWFLEPRGAAGRTPSIWDLNARLVYPILFSGQLQTRLIFDVFHIASQREALDLVQQHYFVVDQNGNPVGLNPNYGVAYRYQPPMSIRLGMEMSF